MKQEYLPTTKEGRYYRFIEEMGEVLQMMGKGGRWGTWSQTPEPHADQRPNIFILHDELVDLEHALHQYLIDVREEILWGKS